MNTDPIIERGEAAAAIHLHVDKAGGEDERFRKANDRVGIEGASVPRTATLRPSAISTRRGPTNLSPSKRWFASMASVAWGAAGFRLIGMGIFPALIRQGKRALPAAVGSLKSGLQFAGPFGHSR